jgi:hypothetical protein
MYKLQELGKVTVRGQQQNNQKTQPNNYQPVTAAKQTTPHQTTCATPEVTPVPGGVYTSAVEPLPS